MMPATRGRADKPRRERAAAPHPFRRGKVYWARMPRAGGDWPQRSLKTADAKVALARCAMLRAFAAEGKLELLDRLIAGQLPIDRVHEAYRQQRLQLFLDDWQAAEHDLDLEPLVEAWHRDCQQRGIRTGAEYCSKVRTLIVPGRPFPRSMLSVDQVQKWLCRWSGPTRNRHRTALSSFCKYGTECGVLHENVALAVRSAKEHAPRVRYLEPEERARLLDALPLEFRLVHALLMGTGGDVAALLQVEYRKLVRREDGTWSIDIPGTKTHSRDGVRRILCVRAERELEAHLNSRPGAGEALLFGHLLTGDTSAQSLKAAKDRVRLVLIDTLAKCGITGYSSRDHRHTFAVQALREGYVMQVVAKQLGHKDTVLVQRVYGKFVVRDEDYVRRTALVLPSQEASVVSRDKP